MAVTITRNPNLMKSQNPIQLENEVMKNFSDKYKTSWWTGLSPAECPGFDHDRNCLVALPLLNLEICTKQDVLDSFNNVWTLTELLFSGIKSEQTYIRPPYHGLRHPLMFYYGHPAVLYYNKMRISNIFKEPINLYLEKILETGVDEMSWDDMGKNEMAWPKLIEVHAYRKRVYDLIIQFINNCEEFNKPLTERRMLMDSPLWSLWMGMEHEKIHIETTSVLMRELPIELLERPTHFSPLHPSRNEVKKITNSWIKGSKCDVTLGKSETEPSFGWDNEYGTRTIAIKDFQFTKNQITNHEFFEFVSSGSYINDKYWEAEGLHWRKFRNTKRPTFWSATGPEGSHEYELRTIFEIIPMPWNFPCEVNYHEAIAYCNYSREKANSKNHYRLFTEAEYSSLRNKGFDPVLQNKKFSDYKKYNETYTSNYNLVWSSPENVNSDLRGNVWHWVMDQFNPLNNFKIQNLYDDFSTPCFDGKHQMILGGSFMSCGEEASLWARFHFRPHFYQHAGFRMAYTEDGSKDNGTFKISNSIEYVHPRRLNVLDQMNNKEWWKEINQPLEMTEDEIQNIFEKTTKNILNFSRGFNDLSPMGNAHDPNINGLKADFSVPYIQTKNFPTAPSSYDDLLTTIFEDLAPISQLPGHPGFGAYVAGCTNTISNTAQLIAQTINPFTGHYMMAPGLVTLEEEAIKWFVDLFGFNSEVANGFFTTGSSYAALSAMMMARQKKLEGHDFSKAVGYISSLGHHSIAKNWSMLGFKKENLKIISVNKFKMDLDDLNKQIAADKQNNLKPFIVFSTLGSTKIGSVDPINKISDIAEANNLWHHIDGAYGAPFMLTKAGRELFIGIERCDSLTLDLHKAFSLPYGTGLLLIKNVSDMLFDYSSDDSYMPPKPDIHYDISDISPELSRDFRGLRVWLPIKTLGINPFILNLEEKIELSKYANLQLKKMKNIVVVNDPELTIQTFKHSMGNEHTKRLLTMINNDQTIFLSGATVNGEEVIRLCLLGLKFHFEILETGLKIIEKLSSEIK